MIILGLAGNAGSGKDTVADWFVQHKGFVKLSFSDSMKRFVLQLFTTIHRDHLWGPSEMRGATVSVVLADYWPEVCDEWCKRIFRWPEPPDNRCPQHLEKLIAWARGYQQRGHATVREILQTLGTEWGRAIDPLLWVKDLYQRQVPEVLDPKWFGWKKEWNSLDDCGLTFTGSNYSALRGVVIPDHRFPNEVEYTKSHQGKKFEVADGRWGIWNAQVWRVARPGFEKAPVGGIQGHSSEGGLAGVKFDVELDLPEGLHKVPFLLEAVSQRFLGI